MSVHFSSYYINGVPYPTRRTMFSCHREIWFKPVTSSRTVTSRVGITPCSSLASLRWSRPLQFKFVPFQWLRMQTTDLFNILHQSWRNTIAMLSHWGHTSWASFQHHLDSVIVKMIWRASRICWTPHMSASSAQEVQLFEYTPRCWICERYDQFLLVTHDLTVYLRS